MLKKVRKQAILLCVVLGFIISFAALMSFDRKVEKLIYASFQETEGVSLHFLQKDFSEYFLQEKLISTLEKYNLNAYYTYYDVNTNESILFTHSTDERYLKPLYTKSKDQLRLVDFEGYSSISNDVTKKILNYGLDEIRIIKPILNSDDARYSVYDFHAITANDMSIFDDDIDLMVSTLHVELSEVGGVIADVDNSHINTKPYIKNHIIIIVSASLIVGILIMNMLFGNVKEISILKLEGDSTGEIFKSLVGYPIIIVFFVQSIFYFLIYYFIIDVPFDLGVYLIRYYVIYIVIAQIVLLVTNLISYVFIVKVPLYQFVKGKIHIEFLSNMLDLFKVVVVVLIILTSTEMTYVSKSFISQLQNRPQYQEEYKKFYILNRIKLGYKFMFTDEENTQLLSRFEDYNGFKEEYGITETIHIVNVDKRFLNRYKIPYIEDAVYSRYDISDSLKQLISEEYGLNTSLLEKIPELPTYSLVSGYEGSDYYSDLPLVYVVEPTDQILGTLFEYDGSLEEAQKLVDDIFADLDLKSPFIVQGLFNNAEAKYHKTKNDLGSLMIQSIILLILYIQVTVSSLNIYRVVYEREDMLEKIEGVLVLKSSRNSITITGIIFLVVMIINIVLNNGNLQNYLGFLLVFIAIDIGIHAKPRKAIKL